MSAASVRWHVGWAGCRQGAPCYSELRQCMTWKGGHLDRKRARHGSEHITYCYRAHSIAFTPEKVMASCNKRFASLLSWDGAGRRPITCPLGVWLGQASAWPGRAIKKVCTEMLTLERRFQLSCCAAWACLHVKGLQMVFICWWHLRHHQQCLMHKDQPHIII